MQTEIRSLSIQGLHRRLDLNIQFGPGVNILYGRNGTGKTTILHILANLLNRAVERFAFLEFHTIEVCLRGQKIVISRDLATDGDDQILRLMLNGDLVVGPISVNNIKKELRMIEPRDEVLDQLSRIREQAKLLPVEAPTYFPAFRTMIEAWVSAKEYDDYNYRSRPPSRTRVEQDWDPIRRGMPRAARRSELSTRFARNLFGQFIPQIDYPTPSEIESRLHDQILRAVLSVGRTDRDILTQAFLDAFSALTSSRAESRESAESLLSQIQDALDQLDRLTESTSEETRSEDVYSRLRAVVSRSSSQSLTGVGTSVLEVYRDSLRRRLQMQAEAFEPIERYAASVNDFLDEKRLVFHRALSGPNWPHVALKFLDGTKTQLRALSSGERQIVCMLFAAADSQLGDVVLIDEPELSLHVDWQRKLLQKMNEQLGLRQMIVCTHSPEVGADFLDNMIEVMPTTTSLLSRPGSESDDELPDDLVLDEVEF